MPWEAGTEVRLIDDPGMVGICTGNTRLRGGNLLVQVGFPGLGKSFHPEYELEPVTDDHEDVYTLIERGRYAAAGHLRRNLTHIQLAGRLANLVYSMEATHTDFYAYQYKPVLAFLESPANALLIADEVGLGKTIEAGLIWTELRARLDARRLVVACPAMLREKWQLELSRRFGVDGQIVDAADLYRALQEPVENVPDGKALICSLQGVRPPRGWREAEDGEGNDSARAKLARFLSAQADEEPMIDLLVVDEAHYLRNPDTQTNRLGHLLRDVAANTVLLSATPINLADQDLFELLNLVDPDTFQFRDQFPRFLAQNEPILRAQDVVRRANSTWEEIREHLEDALGQLSNQEATTGEHRALQTLLQADVTQSQLADAAFRAELAGRVERLNLLNAVVVRTRKVDVTEFRTVRRPMTESVPMTKLEAELYNTVTNAIREFALKRDVSEGFLLASPQRQISSCMVAALRAWASKATGRAAWAEQVYEDFGVEADDDDDDDENRKPLISRITEVVDGRFDINKLRAQDSKYKRLRTILRKLFAENSNEKVILFSYFRGTITYLNERLAEDGITSTVLMGGMVAGKQQTIDTFREDVAVRVLLATEVAAEGVDLQFSRFLVNYDLPWNPMRVEQRIGRIDRIGQQAEVINVWNLCLADTIDARILQRLYERLELFSRALGGMESVLGDEIAKLTMDLLSRRLTPEEETRRIDQTAQAIENKRRVAKEVEEQAGNLLAHGGHIIDAVHVAHEFSRRVTEDDILAYVRDYLERHAQGHVLQQPTGATGEFDLKLPPATAARLGEFVKAKRLQGRTRLPTGEQVRCRFSTKVELRTGRVEQISQFHPLVRFVSEELSRGGEAFYPAIAARVPVPTRPTPVVPGHYAFIVQRWSFSGLRTEEELRARAVHINGERVLNAEWSLNLVNHVRSAGEDWPAAGNILDAAAVIRAVDRASVLAEKDFGQAVSVKFDENHDRVSFQRRSLQQHLDRRRASLEEVRARHQRFGRASLVKATQGQIRKLSDRVSIQLEALAEKAELKRSRFDICVGVVEVY